MKHTNLILSLFISKLFTNVNASAASDLYCEEGICTRISHEPVSDQCKDHTEECGPWAKMGECDINPSYMHGSCARSCGKCPIFTIGDDGQQVLVPVADEACDDVEKPSECQRLAELGECLLRKDFMQENCAATCFFCVNEKSLRAEGVSEDDM